jgi:hypothetical protein
LFSQIFGTALITPKAVAHRSYGRELAQECNFRKSFRRSTRKRKLSILNGLQSRYSSPSTEKNTLQVDVSRIAQKFAERSDA